MKNIDILFKIIKSDEEIATLNKKIDDYKTNINVCNEIIDTSNLLYNFIDKIVNSENKVTHNENNEILVNCLFESTYTYLSPILAPFDDDIDEFNTTKKQCETKLKECKLISRCISDLGILYEYKKEYLNSKDYPLNKNYKEAGIKVSEKVSIPIQIFEQIVDMYHNYNQKNKQKSKHFI